MARNPSHLGSKNSPPCLAGSGMPFTAFASIGWTGGITGRSMGAIVGSARDTHSGILPGMATSMTTRLTVPLGPVDLASYKTRAKPGFKGKKQKGKAVLYALGEQLADLQERLFAEGMTGGNRSVLLVLQGMDTSGKGGIVRHSLALVDPQGVHTKAFKAPTRSERRHDFLWRIERALPEPGMIGVFDRSHYEDVLVAKVEGLVPEDEIARRYDAINAFEKRLVEDGHRHRQVHAAHLGRGAEEAAAGPAGPARQALEVRPG